MVLKYNKNNNNLLFKTLENNLEDICNIQNYIPIYNIFFNLNNNNYNLINLNDDLTLKEITNKIDDNIFQAKILNDSNIQNKKIFLKYSPLLDPHKFVLGKYRNNISSIKLPSLNYNKNEINNKLNDPNNSAYVDGFFSYLTSKLLNQFNFINGIQHYGSFIGFKKNFTFEITDDIDTMIESDYFNDNYGELFETKNNLLIKNNYTKKYKQKINIIDTDISFNILYDETLYDTYNDNFNDLSNNIDTIFNYNIETKNNISKSSSNCSSRSSNTSKNSGSEGSEDEYSGSELESCSNSDISGYSSSASEYIKAEVFDFPVQIICLEGLTNTLDSLLEVEDEDDEMDTLEWNSCLFQIIISLIVYQKTFNFTHNDLHTNNIMYVETDRQYLYYKLNGLHYKVPTFGKIFKIIDFGRAIYKHSNKTFCCDSFSPKGDASSQYNCEPYFNPNKPRLEPNKSFDLCRLACSLFDYFFDDIEEVKHEKDYIALLIAEWCRDDKGRNMLYKNNGEERYPDFKLYKMIARSVHNHNPEDVIKHSLFEKYITTSKKLKKVKKDKILNVDELPRYY